MQSCVFRHARPTVAASSCERWLAALRHVMLGLVCIEFNSSAVLYTCIVTTCASVVYTGPKNTSNGERVSTIGQHLAKLQTNNITDVYWLTVYSKLTTRPYTISRSSKNSNNIGSICNMSGQYALADVTRQEVSVCRQKCRHLFLPINKRTKIMQRIKVKTIKNMFSTSLR